MKGYLNVSEAAERLGLTRQRVHALVSNGKLPAQRIGRAWVLKEKDVDEFAAKPKDKGGRPRKERE